MPAFKSKVDSIAANQGHYNILFVIDATNGMGEYFPAIGKAIRSFAADADSSKTYQYAALVYRDAAEGAFLSQHTGRRTSAEEVANYVDRTIALKNADTDEPEAVFYGLKEALKLQHLKKGESNAVILIGDAGNHAQAENTKVAPEEIADLMATIPSHFFAIQVRHPAPSTYDEFIPQIKDEIIMPAVQKRAEEVSEVAGTENINWQTTTADSGTRFTFNQGNSYINELYMLEKGATMDPEALTAMLQEILQKVIQETDKRVGDLETLKSAGTLDPSRMNAAAVMSTLKNGNVPEEQLNYLKKPDILEETKTDE